MTGNARRNVHFALSCAKLRAMKTSRRDFVTRTGLALTGGTVFKQAVAEDAESPATPGETPLIVSTWPFGKAASGRLALQDHGDAVAYRNLRIRRRGLVRHGTAPPAPARTRVHPQNSRRPQHLHRRLGIA